MALPHFHSNPLRDSVSASRRSAARANVRSILSSSSVYSRPTVSASNTSTPKLPGLGFLRRQNTPPSTPLPQPEMVQVSRDSLYSAPHLQPRYPTNIPSSAHRNEEEVVVLDFGEPEPVHSRRPSGYSAVDPETEQLAIYIQRQARRRQRRAWVRKRNDRPACSPSRCDPVRSKCILCVVSGILLAAIITIYLALVLTSDPVAQEVHVLGLLGILITTIVFCHSLIRLCMLAHRPARTSSARRRGRVAGTTDCEGFVPEEPIPVYLAQDEEGADHHNLEAAEPDNLFDEKEAATVKAPPPAYGLWRHSVRANPDFLHWAPASAIRKTATQGSQPTSPVEHQATESSGPRPPSYASDDGVAYVVQAVPRSVAPAPGAVEVHPAYRY